jgi:heme A synthase
VFGDGTAAHRLPQYFSYTAYFILLAGALWSAWKMRGRPELKDRFVGTLLIAVGATIVAGGAAFAAEGKLPGFVLTLVVGIIVMFWGFVRASRPVVIPDAAPVPAQAADQAG